MVNLTASSEDQFFFINKLSVRENEMLYRPKPYEIRMIRR